MQMKEMKDGFRETALEGQSLAKLLLVTHSNINEAVFLLMPLMDGGVAREANAGLMSGLYSPRSKRIIPWQQWGGFYLARCRDLGFRCPCYTG